MDNSTILGAMFYLSIIAGLIFYVGFICGYYKRKFQGNVDRLIQQDKEKK